MSNLTNEQLEKLPTHRLLALFKTKQKSISTVGRRYDSGVITKEEFDVEFAQHEFIKSLLDNREHIEGKRK